MKNYSIYFLCLFLQGNLLFAHTDTIRPKVFTIAGSISANTNGFSLVPTFSLGKPALQTGFNLSNNHSRLSFHPQIWYSLLDYKPWSFIFIWRYKITDKEKFSFIVGTHAPAINFKSSTVLENDQENDVLKARRFYPALEIMPTYKFSKSSTMGLYYIFGVGIDKEVSTINNFISIRADFNRIKLSKKNYLKFNPQIYFLSIDKSTGIYAALGAALGRNGLPFNVSSNFNKALKSSINADPFAWNIGLNYEFSSQFLKKEQ